MKIKHFLILLLLAFVVPPTAMAQKTLPYSYGFENNDLYDEGWTLNSMTSNSKIYAYASRTGSYGFRFYRDEDIQYLISPELTVSEAGLDLVFYYNAHYYEQSFYIGYSTTTSEVTAFTFGDALQISGSQWTVYEESLPVGTKYVAIKYPGSSGYESMYLDDFYFEYHVAYPKPLGLAVTNYTTATATLDWTARSGQDHWDLYYTTSTEAPTASTTPSVSNTDTKPYTISGLTAGVTYYAYVRGNYETGTNYSEWSEACSFSVGCDAPLQVLAYPMYESAIVYWEPASDMEDGQVAYSTNENFNPDDPSTSVVDATDTYSQLQLQNLTPNTTYYIYVRTNCGDGYSDWSDKVSFTTACLVPNAFVVSDFSVTSATLSWSPSGDEDAWQLSYSTTEGFDPDNGTIVEVSETPYCTLNDLILDTPYYAAVRAKCSDTDHSAWSSVVSFTPTYHLTVNKGTDYNYNIPMYYGYGDGLDATQFIIPASALENDILYANITQLSFFCYEQSVSWDNAVFDVCLKEVNETAFSSTTPDWTNVETVYSGNLTVSNGQMKITFDTPYQYLGGNLLVGIRETTNGTSNFVPWYGVNTDYNSALGGYTTSNGSNFSYQQFLPKTSIVYTPGTAPSCPKPKNLTVTALTSTTATLDWTNGGEETAWQIVYATDPSFNPDNYNPINITEKPYTLGGLLPETTFYVYIRANCGDNDVSAWSQPISFTPSMLATVTVNEGTETDAMIPIWGSVVQYYSQSQFVIPAASLASMNGKDIARMTYYSFSESVAWGNAEFDVFLKEVDYTELPSKTHDWTGMTKVYSGSLSVSGSEMAVVFDDVYSYQGGNLLVGFKQTVAV